MASQTPTGRASEAVSAVSHLLAAARAAGRRRLTEIEAFAVLRVLGIGVPVHRLVADAEQAAAVDLSRFPSPRLVVKVVSPDIVHKSDVGGVVEVAKEPAAVRAAVETMERRFAGREIAGYSLNERVVHDTDFGGELLLGLRWTPDFGPVVAFGPGGIYAEHLCAHLRPGHDLAILSPSLHGESGKAPVALEDVLAGKAITPAVAGGLRGRRPRIEMRRLTALLRRLLAFAAAAVPAEIAELEINPLVFAGGEPIALDAFARLGDGQTPAAAAPRPLAQLGHLLEPRSIAVVGVSRQLNPGRLILRNVLRAGFPSERLHVVKAGVDTIDGCRCVPDVASLPDRMGLVVLAIDAAQVPAAVEEIVAADRAESLILIPGGLGETSGSEDRARRVAAALAAARREGRGPVVNGGNCLGVRSRPGHYDTLFIPEHKLRFTGAATPLALVTQSGAFAVARASKLWTLDPRYLITVGNQLDLTIGDYLTYLKEDPGVRVFACYVEGFRPLDGRRFLEAAAEITRGGRPVILYRAGRTAAGAEATASHTASIAGDYATTRELARAAGVVVADSLADFEGLVTLFCLLHGKTVGGRRLGAVSNAGFECVAVADRLGYLRLAAFGEETSGRLAAILDRSRLGSIVDVGNPLDLTPILGDAAYEEAVRAVLDDDGVDVGVVGCVPLTGALDTLAAADGHGEDLAREGSVVQRLATLATESPKAWVAVVDGGPLYDPMAASLEERGVPVFRAADRALELFGTFCRWRLDHGK